METTREKRARERSKWSEFKIILERYRALGFEYIVTQRPPSRICFGSTRERDTWPPMKKEPRSRRILTTIKKAEVKKFDESFLSKTPRFDNSIIIDKRKIYNPNDQKQPVKKAFKPFGKSMKTTVILSPYPGPATYNLQKKRKYIYMDSFGGRRRIIPAVRTICTAQNLDICYRCNQTPKGDYWLKGQTEIGVALCRQCMTLEVLNAKTTKLRNEIRLFEKVRNCIYFHNHHNTSAAVTTVLRPVVKMKHRIENYLSIYDEYEIKSKLKTYISCKS